MRTWAVMASGGKQTPLETQWWTRSVLGRGPAGHAHSRLYIPPTRSNRGTRPVGARRDARTVDGSLARERPIETSTQAVCVCNGAPSGVQPPCTSCTRLVRTSSVCGEPPPPTPVWVRAPTPDCWAAGGATPARELLISLTICAAPLCPPAVMGGGNRRRATQGHEDSHQLPI